MKKRKFERCKPDQQSFRAEFILTDECKIKDISRGGMCIETTKYLYHDLKLRIGIVHENRRITPSCEIVRSVLKGSVKSNGRELPVYEVALRFSQLSDLETTFLEEIETSTNTDWLLSHRFPS